MTAEQVPPRPDGLHPIPVPVTPPRPDASFQRPQATWRVWEAVVMYVVALLVGGLATIPILSLVDDEDLANLASTAVAAFAITGILIGWLSQAHPTWRGVLGMPRGGEWWPEIRASLGFGLVLYPGMVFGVGLIVTLILSAISGGPVETPEQVPSGLTSAGIAVTALYAVVIAPVHEELFFRGVLFRAARDRYGLGAGLAASGIGFALIHYLPGPWQDALLLMGVMLFNGIALAWWYERRGTIVAPVVAHMVFNVIGLTLIWTIG